MDTNNQQLVRWSRVPSLLLGALLLTACPSQTEQVESADAALPPAVGDLGVAITTAGLFEDCTPDGTVYSDVRCASGLHCAIVLVGTAIGEGAIAQCVPDEGATLKEDAECVFAKAANPATDPPRRYASCAKGLDCVGTADGTMRCKRLCAQRTHGNCGKSELCVLPSQISGIGFCSRPDKCEPVFPQTGCGKAKDGSSLSCYVLGDDKSTGTVCWPKQRYGSATGDLDSPCERSYQCQSGFACVTGSGRDATCRPYCTLPTPPDGGTSPDGGSEVLCASGLGTCRAISGYERIGRCY